MQTKKKTEKKIWGFEKNNLKKQTIRPLKRSCGNYIKFKILNLRS